MTGRRVGRRRVLASLTSVGATALAGCNALLGGEESATPATGTPRETGTERPTETPDGDPDGPDVEIAEAPYDRDPLDVDDARDVGATLLRYETVGKVLSLSPARYRTPTWGEVRLRFAGGGTEEEPPRVEATLTNPTPFENVYALRSHAPFGPASSRGAEGYADVPGERGSRLLCIPTPNHDLAPEEYEEPPGTRRDDGVWYVGRDAPPGLSEFPDLVRLGPEETVYGESHLLVESPGGGIDGLAPGAHRFRGRGDDRVQITVWDADEPGPTGPSRLSATEVPPLPLDAETRWYHEADGWSTVYCHPSEESVRLPARVRFTLVNHDEEPLGGFRETPLYKLVDGEWLRVESRDQTSLHVRQPPGSRRDIEVTAFDGPGIDDDHYHHLGGGTYATAVTDDRGRFVVETSGDSRGGSDDSDEPSGVAHAALVEFDADPTVVEPERGLSVEREPYDGDPPFPGDPEGDLVIVRSPRWEENVEGGPHVLTLHRATDGEAADAERLVPEQVMQPSSRGLRNSLPFLDEETAAVRLETDGRTAFEATARDEARRFRFEGEAYVVRAESR